jgi:hypothetical protein
MDRAIARADLHDAAVGVFIQRYATCPGYAGHRRLDIGSGRTHLADLRLRTTGEG